MRGGGRGGGGGGGRGGGSGPPQPPIRVADSSNTPAEEPRVGGGPAPAQGGEHPLMSVLRWGKTSLKVAETIQDYSATVVKRERIDGKVNDPEYMFVKIRHKPLSVYLHFLKPDHLKGQEVVWVQGQNNGKMWGHAPGIRKVFGTIPFDPTPPPGPMPPSQPSPRLI